MSEFQIQIKLEFQMRGYLKLKCLNFNFSQIGSSVTRLSEIKMSEFKFRYLKIVSEFRFQSTFPEIPASEFEIQTKINFSHNKMIKLIDFHRPIMHRNELFYY